MTDSHFLNDLNDLDLNDLHDQCMVHFIMLSFFFALKNVIIYESKKVFCNFACKIRAFYEIENRPNLNKLKQRTIKTRIICEPTLKSKACLKCLYFTKIISDLCCYLE